jgi:hypothetical protein
MKKIPLLTFLFAVCFTVYSQTGNQGWLKDKIRPCDHSDNEGILPSPNDSIQKYSARVWPNPSIESFNLKVESPSSQRLIVLISDLMGKKVEEFGIKNNTSLAFGKMFPPGLYIIRVKQGSEVMSTFKLIKQ